MQKLSYILSKYYWVLIVVLVSISFYHCGRQDVKEKVKKEQVVVYKDSIRTIEKNSKEIEERVKTQQELITKLKSEVKTLKAKTIITPKECEPIVRYKDSIISKLDTIIIKQDSVIKGKDSIIYLDRKVIEYKDKIINLPKTRKRLGLGVQAGYGIDNRPYVGLGVSYNLFVF